MTPLVSLRATLVLGSIIIMALVSRGDEKVARGAAQFRPAPHDGKLASKQDSKQASRLMKLASSRASVAEALLALVEVARAHATIMATARAAHGTASAGAARTGESPSWLVRAWRGGGGCLATDYRRMRLACSDGDRLDLRSLCSVAVGV
jgi:hypothetical protein